MTHDVGELVLWLERAVSRGVLSAWRVAQSPSMCTVECFCATRRPIVCSNEDLLKALQAAATQVSGINP